MIAGKKLIVCMPAFNAGKTLERTFKGIPEGIVDEVILVDDHSADDTVEVAQRLGISQIIEHDINKGYGGNQKTCYQRALELGGEVIIMLHPDYQYNPSLIPAMAGLVAKGIFPVVLGSRILGKGAMKLGMPAWKYFANRILTLGQNIMLGQKLSEYHTGYRAYNSEVLRSINFMANDDGFVFDNQLLAQVIYKGYTIGEISCPAKYFPDASSIGFTDSMQYGLGVMRTSVMYCFNKWGMARSEIFR